MASEPVVDLAEYVHNTERTLRSGGPKWKVNDDWVWWRRDRRMPRHLRFDEDAGFLVGLYLAEGSTGGAINAKHQVNFALHRRETYIADFIDEQARRLFAVGESKRSYTHGDNGMAIHFGSRAAAQIFSSMGTSRSKAIPWGWMGWPIRLRLQIVRGWLVGDGNRAVVATGLPRLVGTSVSRSLIEQMSLTLLEAGYQPQTQGFLGYGWQIHMTVSDSARLLANRNPVEMLRWPWELPTVRERTNTRGVLVSGGQASRLRAMERVPFDGVVDDLVVEDDHSYCIEGVAVCDAASVAVVADAA